MTNAQDEKTLYYPIEEDFDLESALLNYGKTSSRSFSILYTMPLCSHSSLYKDRVNFDKATFSGKKFKISNFQLIQDNCAENK